MSEGSPTAGVSVDVHENPYEPAAQPATVASAAHVFELKLTQQYSDSPPGPGTAVLQSSDESLASGVSVDVHEKPYEAPVQPETVESATQLLELNVTQQ